MMPPEIVDLLVNAPPLGVAVWALVIVYQVRTISQSNAKRLDRLERALGVESE